MMVIGADGDQLGVMPTSQALTLARERNLDLVEVAPTNTPPVCRILDYGRLRYLSAKKERDSKKAQKNTSLREVRFRPNIGDHDLSAKVRKIKELLDDGSKVKVSVFFRGREVTHQQIGMQRLKQIVDDLQEEAKMEQAPSFEQRHLTITLAPLPRRGERKTRDSASPVIPAQAGTEGPNRITQGEEDQDAEIEDAQGGSEAVSRDGHGQDNAPQADEQSQPSQEAQESSSAVRG